jgi:hypothetical protein
MYSYTCFQKRIFLRSQALSQYDFLIIPTGYFTGDNESDNIKNATHNTFSKSQKKPDIKIKISGFFSQCIVGCIFNAVRLVVTREISFKGFICLFFFLCFN